MDEDLVLDLAKALLFIGGLGLLMWAATNIGRMLG